MKKVFVAGLVLVCLFFLMGATDVPSIDWSLESPKADKHCQGYTIIEYGKAVDCHGDTIRLVYRDGLAIRTAH
jgi:hypothetical protein